MDTISTTAKSTQPEVSKSTRLTRSKFNGEIFALSTNEVQFSNQSLTVRCHSIHVMASGLIITQVPKDVDNGDKIKCIFVLYREINQLQLSKSPTLESNYMFITVTQRIANIIFDEIVGSDIYKPRKFIELVKLVDMFFIPLQT